MGNAQKNNIKEAETDLRRLLEWSELTQEEQTNVLSQLEDLKVETTPDLQGLKQLINQEFNIHSTLQDLRKRIVAMGRERAHEKEKQRQEKAREENIFIKTVAIPKSIATLNDLNNLLKALEQVRANAMKHDKVDIRFKLDDPPE